VTHELTRKGTQLFLRYLPAGVAVGRKGSYLSVSSYPLANAIRITERAASRLESVVVPAAGGGVAFYYVDQAESRLLRDGEGFRIVRPCEEVQAIDVMRARPPIDVCPSLHSQPVPGYAPDRDGPEFRIPIKDQS
jgi:hypothetical protein